MGRGRATGTGWRDWQPDACLDGRVGVVTGAARGMGRQIAEALRGAGAQVVAVDRSWTSTRLSHDDAAGAKNEFAALGVQTVAADVTDDAAVAQLLDGTVDKFGGVDILVNNAAMRMREVSPAIPGYSTPFLDISIEEWQRMIDVNLLGPVRLIRAVVPSMIERGGGAIINISSSSGVRGRGGDSPYGASKAALTNLTEALAAELEHHGIGVNSLFPGITQTTGHDEQAAAKSAAPPRPASSGGQDSTSAALPLIMLHPRSVAPPLVWLSANGAKVTGQTLTVWEWLVDNGLGPLDRWAV